jgi:uncharacterized membrane protein YfhO
VQALVLEGNSCSATLVAPDTAWVWVSLAPVTGWRWWVDGETVTLVQGPGIVQYLEVSEGTHRIEGRYRPPGLMPLIVVSCTALVGVLWCFWFATKGRPRVHDESFRAAPTDPREEP